MFKTPYLHSSRQIGLHCVPTGAFVRDEHKLLAVNSIVLHLFHNDLVYALDVLFDEIGSSQISEVNLVDRWFVPEAKSFDLFLDCFDVPAFGQLVEYLLLLIEI